MLRVAVATWVTVVAASGARAESFAAPVGGSSFVVTGDRVVCSVPGGGWSTDAARRTLRPPAQASPGTRTDAVVAAGDSACATSGQRVSLVVTAHWPTVERAVLAVDEGSLEVRGHGLVGMQARWGRDPRAGAVTCDQPELDGGVDVCRFPASGADATTWTWLPGGARGDETVFDAEGRLSRPEVLALPVARTELAMVVRPDAVIDAFSAGSVVALRHADLVAAVDCAPAACVVDGDGLLVSNVPSGAASLAVRVRFASRVVLRRGDAAESSPVLRIPIVRCPLAVVSGPPLRAVDTQALVLEVGGRCGHDLDRLQFQVGGAPADRGRVTATADRVYVTLRIGRTEADAISIAAVSDLSDGIIAQVRVATRAAPAIRVGLELARRGIDFIPTNVAAAARATSADWDGSLELVAIDGVYVVEDGGHVRGVTSSGGVVAIRVGLHRRLPAPVGDIEIATVAEPVQHPLREATNVAPLLTGEHPLVELLCDDGRRIGTIPAGATAHVPFDHHDSCRLVLHRERLEPAMGAQRLMLEVDVTRVDGSPRSEARVARRLTLVHDDAPRTLWLRGAEGRFDRYTVRLSQDEDDRVHDDELPSAQWSVVTGRGRARIYATSAIPTGLYRVSDRDHSGILTLNFGVLARATWLDSLGREGILCLEAGALTVGLANDTSVSGKSLTQVATIAGLGLSVPIANRALAAETAVNLHAWIELEPSRAFGAGSGSAWAFVFGPSITVGNLGADL